MKRIFAAMVVSVLLLLSACGQKPEESLSFVDETSVGAEQEGSSKEAGKTGGTEQTESTKQMGVLFSKDWDQHYWTSTMSGIISGNRLYFPSAALKNTGDRFLYEADPVKMSYRPLCKKPGCQHDDSGCYAFLPMDGEDGHWNGTYQAYDDGIYLAVSSADEGTGGVTRILKIDPEGKKPKTPVYEIPMDGLMYVTNEYQVYPEVWLHRGYAVINASSQSEAGSLETDGEEISPEESEEEIDPQNPYNQMARIRNDYKLYISVYDLEKEEMTPVMTAVRTNVSYAYANVKAYGDELYIQIFSVNYHAGSVENDEGEKEYTLEDVYGDTEIYRWTLGSSEAPEKVYRGKLPFQYNPNIRIDQGRILMLGELSEDLGDCKEGDSVLLSMDPETGAFGTPKKIPETADGKYPSGLTYGDGYIIFKSVGEDPEATGYEAGTETFEIYDTEGEKINEFTVQEKLPSFFEAYALGAGIIGGDSEYLYCSNSTAEKPLFYRISLNDGTVEYFTAAEAESAPEPSEEETAEEEVLTGEEFFSDYDRTTGAFGNAFAQDEEHLYVPVRKGENAGHFFLYSVDKKTAKMEALCSKPDCKHNSKNCEACFGSVGLGPLALGVSDRFVYCALQQFTGSPQDRLIVYACDLLDKTWHEKASVSMMDAGIQKNGYGNSNWGGFFHQDSFYYYTVRNRQIQGKGVFGFQNVEQTALIYRLPLQEPEKAEMILNEEFPDNDGCFLNAAAFGDDIIYVLETENYESYDEETGDISYSERNLRISSYHLASEETEVLYEAPAEFGIQGLYPEKDGLYIQTYPSPTTEIVQYFDYASKNFAQVGEEQATEYATMDFDEGGYWLLSKPSRFVETTDLSCTFYDFKGEKIREFSYRMPEEILPEDYREAVFESMYLGADQWNLYYRDVYSREGKDESIVYAIPIAGDSPIVFTEASEKE